MKRVGKFEAVVIGVSAGGMDALPVVLAPLSADFPASIIVVQHLHPHSDGFLVTYLGRKCTLPVKEADEKELLQQGMVYMAPANYHLLVESDRSFSLSIEGRVNYCRPAVDVLFESAAEVFRQKLIGVILTGANSDGAAGLKMIKDYGGVAIAQNPETAEASAMPLAAIAVARPDYVLTLPEIADLLVRLVY